jgi:putative peptide zinc metalloprotease protein
MERSRQSNNANEPEEKAARQITGVAEVPERPSLAPNVRLIGEMKESGFENPQWLVQRGQRFIQLTELLYRVVEQADGKRTLEEMAEGVTNSTDWMVSADNVRQLIQQKLIPLGLIFPAGVVGAAEDRLPEEKRVRSPLGVNMRQKVIGPRFIDPLTGVLQFLFAPLVLIPVLVGVILAHIWLYAVHGVGGALQEIINAPGLTFVVLALVFVSGIFHEFGHAAALRYGGGEVRGMGVGLYLVFPALYTDTTDSYRLGRWARVRTDLGGFYFHLIFALGIVALYLVTGWEFLLFAVLMISLDIVYQCMPFVRFDGYWALADLTGVPDFFSQMGAFLRSVLPVPGWRGKRLPDLKPRVKVVFLAYVLVTVPILSLLLFMLVSHLPETLEALWSSLSSQVEAFSRAFGRADVLEAVMAGSRVFILVLQVLGIAYLLGFLSWKLTRFIWNWSSLSVARRIGAAIFAVCVLVLLAFLWMS